MASRKFNEMGASELKSELLDLRKEQFNLRMQNSTGQITNPARFKVVRREIARIKTRMNEIERTAA
jgi:large subunit ribosomal protein L29